VKYEAERFITEYENFSDSDLNNNYISVYTKSSSIWGGSENGGELKEGKRSVTVSAHNNAGSIKTATRDFYVDITAPAIEITKINSTAFAKNLATNDTKPTISGKITDSLEGDKSENKAASGPKSAEIKIEKKNFAGLYGLHSLVTVNISESYWADTNIKITDNTKNTVDKYSIFSFSPTEDLPAGSYKVSVTGKDNAGNLSVPASFNLNVGTLTEAVKVDEKEIEPEKVIKVIEVPAKTPSVSQNVTASTAAGLTDFYWNVVDAGKKFVKTGIIMANTVGKLWQGYSNFVRQSDLKILAFIVNTSNRAGQTIAFTYNNLAQKAPGIVGSGLRTIGGALGTIADSTALASASFAGYLSGTARNLGNFVTDAVSPTAKTIGEFTIKQQIKLISIAEILFDKNPTIIKNVKVAEVGKDYAVITWETNHYTTNNKINYGESLSYGQDLISQDRARFHEFKITGLNPDKKYYFEVMSKNNNYIYDAYHEFTTQR
jgi:hypothetical protein